jgi:hypothetical protein
LNELNLIICVFYSFSPAIWLTRSTSVGLWKRILTWSSGHW